MRKIYIIIIALFALHACNYLDIVPDERPTEADAFKDSRAAERYLYSCYSFQPDLRDAVSSMDFFTSDEVITPFEHETYANFAKGDYTPSNTYMNDWSNLYSGIRQCYLLLDNIGSVPDMEPGNTKVYKAEAKFLIAYYHYLLLKRYGPIILVTSTPSMETPPSEYAPRTSYDECVQWIAGKFDEAIVDGLLDRQIGSAYGRATSTAAKAIKSRMLLYAASPLYNGAKSSVAETDDLSAYYADFTDEAGNPLISLTYDVSKWQRAADASLAAIQAAETAGYSLYDNGTVTADMPLPSNSTERKLRMTLCDKNTTENVWAWTRAENYYSVQNKSTPYGSNSWNGVGPTLTMVETFYTENGLPISEDPAYDYVNRYAYGTQTRAPGGVTMNLNMHREPRFYAWVAYHNSNYEINKDNAFQVAVQFRKSDNYGIGTRSTSYTPTGYLNKKGVPPLYRQTGSTANGTMTQYSWPIIRLAELYLNYAEALIEVGGNSNLATAKIYIDKVRLRAGVPGVDAAWGPTGKALDQNRMRSIVRQERTIELYLENQRFWDVRRWLLGKKYFGTLAKGMNIQGATDDAFFKVTEVQFARKFLVPQHYLQPIPIGDLNKNAKLVQNPGY